MVIIAGAATAPKRKSKTPRKAATYRAARRNARRDASAIWRGVKPRGHARHYSSSKPYPYMSERQRTRALRRRLRHEQQAA